MYVQGYMIGKVIGLSFEKALDIWNQAFPELKAQLAPLNISLTFSQPIWDKNIRRDIKLQGPAPLSLELRPT